MAANSSKRVGIDYSNVLESIFDLMLSTGLKSPEVLRICQRSMKLAEGKSRAMRVDESGGLVSAALILDAWHRDRRYLNAGGMPRAVRLLGRAPSVEALIRAHKGRKRASDIAHELRNLQLLERCRSGLYRPRSDAAVISDCDPLVLQHAARALSTLVQTVGRNVRSSSSLAPLIERIAEIPDLPQEHVPDFQRFTQIQGRTFLRTVNDWLEARRARRNGRRRYEGTVRAGIHTYAYVAPRAKKVMSTNSPKA